MPFQTSPPVDDRTSLPLTLAPLPFSQARGKLLIKLHRTGAGETLNKVLFGGDLLGPGKLLIKLHWVGARETLNKITLGGGQGSI